MTRKRRTPRICYLLRGNPPAKPATPADNTLPGAMNAVRATTRPTDRQ